MTYDPHARQRTIMESGMADAAVRRVAAVLAANPHATGADVLAVLTRQAADARADDEAMREGRDPGARPAWTYHAENLLAARAAGYDV